MTGAACLPHAAFDYGPPGTRPDPWQCLAAQQIHCVARARLVVRTAWHSGLLQETLVWSRSCCMACEKTAGVQGLPNILLAGPFENA